MSAFRVLIVSENISMKMGGESALPFYYARLLTDRGAEVLLACHERVREELRHDLPSLYPKAHFVADTPLQRLLHRISAHLPYRIKDIIVGQLIHYSTQWRIRRIAQALAVDGKIDIILEPAPISPKGLSFMYGIGVPVVIGPLCGGMSFPPRFRRLDSISTRAVIALSRRLSHIANRLVPGKTSAALILVANEQTERALPKGIRGRVCRLFESGVNLDVWMPPTDDGNGNSEIRFVFSGRFVDWKGIQFLLPAFERALAIEPACRLDLIGGGGEFEGRVRELAQRPAFRDRICLHGWLPHAQAAEIVRQSDVFVMPSLRECGGAAILEAMAMGKPVIATNWGGPADYVTKESGILVSVTSPEEFIQGLANAMILLARSPQLRRSLGVGGMERVKQDHLSWDSKATRMFALLEETIAARSAQAPS